MPGTQQFGRDELAVPSVLDRLIVSPDDSRRPEGQTLREIRERVRRDLQDLLNTRPRCQSWPANLKELDDSLADFGLPDFTGPELSAPANHRRFQRILQQVVEAFEPRLKNVNVELMTRPDQLNRTVTFRIRAMLCVEPFKEQIAFDSTIEPLSATLAVSPGRTDAQRTANLL
jgi:type VI secretion system protein ImpF